MCVFPSFMASESIAYIMSAEYETVRTTSPIDNAKTTTYGIRLRLSKINKFNY